MKKLTCLLFVGVILPVVILPVTRAAINVEDKTPRTGFIRWLKLDGLGFDTDTPIPAQSYSAKSNQLKYYFHPTANSVNRFQQVCEKQELDFTGRFGAFYYLASQDETLTATESVKIARSQLMKFTDSNGNEVEEFAGNFIEAFYRTPYRFKLDSEQSPAPYVFATARIKDTVADHFDRQSITDRYNAMSLYLHQPYGSQKTYVHISQPTHFPEPFEQFNFHISMSKDLSLNQVSGLFTVAPKRLAATWQEDYASANRLFIGEWPKKATLAIQSSMYVACQ